MRSVRVALAIMVCASAPSIGQEWSGWHFGFDAGVLGGQLDVDPSTRFSTNGYSVGATLGRWDYAGNILAGWDVSARVGGPIDLRYASDLMFSYRYENGQAASVAVRGKIGSPVGSFLPYLAAGPLVSFNGSSVQYGTHSNTENSIGFGATAAAGANVAITERVSWTIEAHADVSSLKHDTWSDEARFYTAGARTGFSFKW